MLDHNKHWLYLQLFCQIWLYFNLEVDITPAAYIKAKRNWRRRVSSALHLITIVHQMRLPQLIMIRPGNYMLPKPTGGGERCLGARGQAGKPRGKRGICYARLSSQAGKDLGTAEPTACVGHDIKAEALFVYTCNEWGAPNSEIPQLKWQESVD